MDSSIDSGWFMNVKALTVPKEVKSLENLWEEMFPKQIGVELHTQLQRLIGLSGQAGDDAEANQKLNSYLESIEFNQLYKVVRTLHVKNHLHELDFETQRVEKAPTQAGEGQFGSMILESKLILQSFLDYLRVNGPDKFAEFMNSSSLRLVSTVHPNETERNTNLRHYNSILDKYIEWKKDFDSLSILPTYAPEYRIRRESLNQLRRAIKAEIEGVWQSDQMRRDPIPVESEALRILERYRMIFRAFPTIMKFMKYLAKEAFFLYQAGIHCEKNPEWKAKFLQNYKSDKGTREEKMKAIKKTFNELNITLHPPRITKPLITFGTWKGGDRDGNPFVVASFTNKCFIEQKQFVLQEYISMATQLLDKLTPSTRTVPESKKLEDSLRVDFQTFPYIQNIKQHEPFRAKMRFILERLQNCLARVNEVIKQAGTTTRPLLSQTIPGPSGYCAVNELKGDLTVLYESLLTTGGKAQARSMLQDLYILVDTFGLHMTAIDFRQTSDKNSICVSEYLKAVDLPEQNFRTKGEKEKQRILLDLLCRELELRPWTIPQLSDTSRDTIHTLLVFADAAKTEGKAIGKFIISMCTCVSDILSVLLLMKLVGMLHVKDGRIVHCPFDVTGLFETIGDLKAAPHIMMDLVSIPMIRDYIVEHRSGKMTVMMGYSDSVRDGSSLASDAQVIRCALSLQALQNELNQGLPANKHLHLMFYRGRGDTIPRGYGGSITKAIASQLVCTPEEDHTEQNRYLRCYSSYSSTVDHLHKVYSAHISGQLVPIPANTKRYQMCFDFFGNISHFKWLSLVSTANGGSGDIFFGILRKFGILRHLHKSHFASRPIARGGVAYNIDSIRAIPFTMALAQLREFTTGFYGTGSAFQFGCNWIENKESTTLQLIKAHTDANVLKELLKDSNQPLSQLVLQVFNAKSDDEVDALIKRAAGETEDANFSRLITIIYHSLETAAKEISLVLLDFIQTKQSPLELLREMYRMYAPFRYSIDNKETSLLIRNKKIVDDYTKGCSNEEKAVLDETEQEAQYTKKWVLLINEQESLQSKTLRTDFNGKDLLLLHKIQSKLLCDYMGVEGTMTPEELFRREIGIQMSILAVSEALGFAG